MNLNNPLTSIVRPVEDSYPYYQQPSWEWHHGEAIEIQPDKWPARAGLQFAGFWKMFKRKTDPQDPLTLQVVVWFASSQVNRIVQNHQEILANCLLWCPDATFGMISNVFFGTFVKSQHWIIRISPKIHSNRRTTLFASKFQLPASQTPLLSLCNSNRTLRCMLLSRQWCRKRSLCLCRNNQIIWETQVAGQNSTYHFGMVNELPIYVDGLGMVYGILFTTLEDWH